MRSVIVCFFGALVLSLAAPARAAKKFVLNSPDKKLSIQVEVGDKITWQAFSEGQAVTLPTPISLKLENQEVLGVSPSVLENRTTSVNTQIKGTFYHKELVPNTYNELTLTFKGGYGLAFRAYDEGVAYRWLLRRPGKLRIVSEEAPMLFAADIKVWAASQKDYINSFESTYDSSRLSRMDSSSLYFLPLAGALPSGKKVLVLESDLEAYPGWFLRREPRTTRLYADFAPAVTEIRGVVPGPKKDYTLMKPTQRAPWIAEVSADRNLPWRILFIGTDAQMLDNDLVYKLARPNQLKDISWIKPGRVAWDWWHDWSFWNVDFKAGVNTLTYKHYIDFAAENGLEYILLDEGWNKTLYNIMEVQPEINIPELVTYGQSKKVDVLLWCSAYALMQDMEKIMDHYARMGIKGFKVDFFDRDDQQCHELLEKILITAAKYKLLIDFHGISKPAGLNRTYPNEISREGVMGAEWNKWQKTVSPGHQLNNAFIRMSAGHLDFTPGSMRNAQPRSFQPVNSLPMVQGTRAHHLALFVVYTSPLTMWADSPSEYRRWPESVEFMKQVPTTWDETRVLSAKLGEHLVLARRKGKTWYLAALNGTDQKLELKVPLAFLEEPAEATFWQDGLNAGQVAWDCQKVTREVNKNTLLTVTLEKSGGWVGIVSQP